MLASRLWDPKARSFAASTGSLLAQWADWFRLFYLRRWLIGSIVGLGVAVAIWSVVVADRLYDASVTIYIAPRAPNVVQYQQVVEPQRGSYREEFWYGTQYALLRSEPLVRRVADRLGLWDHPGVLRPVDDARRTAPGFGVFMVVRQWLSDVVDRWDLGGSDQPPVGEPVAPLIDPDLPPLDPRQRSVVATVMRGIAVIPLPDTRLVRVRSRLRNPQLAHDVALALAEEYIGYDIDHRTSAAREAVTWIGDQIAQQEVEVREAEAAVVAFRSAHPDVALGDDTLVAEQGLVELQRDVNEATTVLIARRAAYRQVLDAAGDPDRLVRLPALTVEPALQQAVGEVERLRAVEQRLAERYEGLHPDLISARADVRAAQARLNQRIADLVAGLELSVEVAAEQQRTLRGMLQGRLGARVRAGRITVEHSALVRSAEAAHSILASLERRLHETSVMAQLRTSAARVAEPPVVPVGPASPRAFLRVQFFALASLALAIGLVVLLDQLDARVRTPEDVAAFLSLDTLAMLPHTDGIGGASLGADRAPVFQTAVQSLRSRLLTAMTAPTVAPREGPVFVIVTSAEPGDGKSVVVAELATSFARARRDVLIIDGDFRRARLHHRFGTERSPGFLELMQREVALDAVVRPGGPGVPDLLPAGEPVGAPTEVLQQYTLDGGLGRLDLTGYQWVFIDAPPILPVTDALLLAQFTDVRLFVVDTQRTPRSVVRTAVDALTSHNLPVSGVVLNKVELARHPRYYGRYYRSYYHRYYEDSSLTAG